MPAYRKIENRDTLVDWKEKFNYNADRNTDLKNRLDVLEAGGTTDGEVIGLRSSTTFQYIGETADARVEHAEQQIVETQNRLGELENRDLKIINVREYGAAGDGVTDDSAAIQAALDKAREYGGGEVYVPDGSYAIKAPLRIYSYTRLKLSSQVAIIRAGAFSPMIISGIGNVDEYDGVQHVEICGGTWNGNGTQFPSSFTHIMFGHAKDIVIRDTRMLDNYNSHCIELNAVQNASVIHCLFKGFQGVRFTEAVQLDLAKSASQFPYYGNYDDTPCDNILITGCTFEDWNRGVGSHSATAGVFHTNIRIIGNHFRNLTGQAIRGYQYKHAAVIGNTFENVRMAIEMRPGIGVDASPSGFYVIQGNTITKTTDPSLGHGIWVNGDSGVSIHDVIIEGNVVDSTAVNGIYVEYTDRVIIRGNLIREAGNQGISVLGMNNSQVSGNIVYHAQQNGIVLNSSNDNVVHDNLAHGNGRSGAGVGNLSLVTSSHRNNVQKNTVRRSGGFPEWGIRVTNTCQDNMVTNNDALNGGQASPIQDNGLRTVTTAGNRT
ncbi:glycosyl hydrolase family 28-related protein [Desmospora profundinema]|uniref:Parallel beta-helix repeat protein n=1 Tax=Desmospora profundinema TaxID=1571184 RepID=A0ABU1IL01_9BACL|nr:glycosyl hydrolase family 28-related protein [Desmospora profundinema]MDR6225454.1 parallel beta-helix repeat protein [Desmospora profundinema]